MDIQKECRVHGLSSHFLRKDSGYRCRKCASLSVVKSRAKKKDKLVADFGGKCIKCGYSKCNAALEFHHIDASTKSFGLARKPDLSYSQLYEEAKKCVLLCGNCHAETHYYTGM